MMFDVWRLFTFHSEISKILSLEFTKVYSKSSPLHHLRIFCWWLGQQCAAFGLQILEFKKQKQMKFKKMLKKAESPTD